MPDRSPIGFPALVAAALMLPAIAVGDEAGPRTRETAHVTRTTSPITIDGLLDEPDWQRAEPISEFKLIVQREGQEPLEPTEARLLFDDENVYVGVWCGNRAPGAIRSSMAPRDQNLDDDQIAIHFDTYLDRRRAYIFAANAHGVQLDGILDGDEPDFTWDAVWSVETTRDADGWTAEFEIPLRNMRFPPGRDTWGLWFRRQITKVDEVCSWPLWRQAEQGDIMLQAADLTGFQGVSGGGGIEVQPYVSSTRFDERMFTGISPGLQPSPWMSETDSDVGLDMKYGITSTLVGQATINPDFSQVEADAVQIDVNQRFPLFFPEKRPFFLESAEIFNTDLDLVYTRRIADPSAGGKITGAQGPVRLGLIAAQDRGGGGLAGVGAGPSAERAQAGFVGIARATYDFDDNNSIGFLGTYRDGETRDDLVFAAGEPVSQPTGTRNAVFAGDARLRLGQNVFLRGQFAGSSTEVDSAGNYRTGTAVLDDYAYDVSLRYGDGIRYLNLYQEYLGPDFRTETGFVNRVDVRESGFESDFYVRPENDWLRSWQPILNGYVIHDHTGQIEEWWVSPMIDWVFQKNTTAHTMYVRSMERWLSTNYDQNTYIFRVGNTLFRQLGLGVLAVVGDGIFYGDTDAESFAGWSENYEMTATLRPSPQFTAELTSERLRFSRKFGGEEIFDVWVLGANMTYQFTREFHARVYPQFDTGRERLDADVLLAYVVHPGTALYLGMNGDFREIEGRQRAMRRSYFFKISYRILR